MSSTQPSGYRFGATYVGTNMISQTEAYPLLLADIDPSGNLNANIVAAPSEKTRCKFIAQILQSKWQSAQFTADYKGDLYTVRIGWNIQFTEQCVYVQPLRRHLLWEIRT